MAIISTYVKDIDITANDKLIGSNYKGVDNQGRPIFTTANFKIADLLTYFSENISVSGGGGSSDDLIADVNKIKTLYTFDQNGNYTGLSQAGVSLIANSAVADGFATALFQQKVFTDVLSIDPETGKYTATEAFANTVMTAESTTDYAQASIVNNIKSSIGTFNADGTLISLSEAFANQVMTTETTTDYASAQRTESMAAELGFYDAGTDTYSFSSANLTDTVDALALQNYASTIRVNGIESKVGGKPDVYRQDEPPAIYTGEPSEQVIPEGSIWYDTDADNKVYVVAEDPENAGTFIWTLTDDSRIGATAEQITNIAAEFGSFDANNNFTIDTSAGYFEAVKAYADDDSAAASKISNLGAEIGTFDENNNFSTSLSANFKQAVNNEVDANSATAGYVNNLSAAVGIDKLDGTPQSQATASVNGATSATTTTATLDGIVSGSKQLVLTEVNGDIKVGQYLTYSAQSSTLNRDLVWRVEAIDGINIYLDNEISLEDATTLTFTGTDLLVVDGVTGTIREGFQIKGDGVTPGTYVSLIDGLNITMSRAEVIADNVALEFLGIYAAVTETANVVAKVDGSLESTYGLQVDANGNVAGMKLLANNEGSEVSFLADSFKVYNGTEGEAPFEVVGGVVKIKSANIGSISFGDIDDAPDIFITTVIYADDINGTNPSTTKGSKNFIAFLNADTAWTDGDALPSDLSFSQIRGDDGATGPEGPAGLEGYTPVKNVDYFDGDSANVVVTDATTAQCPNGGKVYEFYVGTTLIDTQVVCNGANGDKGDKGDAGDPGDPGVRIVTGILFYQLGSGTAPSTPSNSGITYDFDNGTFSSYPSNWGEETPEMAAGTASNKYWTSRYQVIESSSGSNSGTPVFFTPIRSFAFNQVVTFDSLGSSGTTVIDGGRITTGFIRSGNWDAPDSGETFSDAGTAIYLNTGAIISKGFVIDDDGNAFFKGDITGASGTFGDVTIDTNGISSTNFSIDSDGNVAIAGNITGSTGTFGGTVSGATVIGGVISVPTNDSNRKFYVDSQGSVYISDQAAGTPGLNVRDDSNGSTGVTIASDRIYTAPGVELYLTPYASGIASGYIKWGDTATITTGVSNKLYITTATARFSGDVEIVGDLTVTGASSSHPNITGASDVDNIGQTVIQSLDFDTFGHVIGTGSVSIAYPAIINNGGAPELPTGVTAAEIRTLIGAGTGSSDFSGSYDDLSDKPTIYAEPGIYRGGGTPTLASGVTALEVRSLIGAGTSSFDGAYDSLSGKPTLGTAAAADAGDFATADHNHTYDVNSVWLREAGDNANFKIYGNSRQIAFRTDGTSEYSTGVGGYPFVWMYGGNASGDRRMILASNGRLWTSYSGWLDAAFASAGHLHDTRYLRKDTNSSSSGTITAQDFILSSDQRLKSDINTYTVKPINIKYRDYVINSNRDRRRVGVLAQELEESHPEFVTTNPDTGYKAVSYIDMLVAKVAELEERIKQLENGSA